MMKSADNQIGTPQCPMAKIESHDPGKLSDPSRSETSNRLFIEAALGSSVNTIWIAQTHSH